MNWTTYGKEHVPDASGIKPRERKYHQISTNAIHKHLRNVNKIPKFTSAALQCQ